MTRDVNFTNKILNWQTNTKKHGYNCTHGYMQVIRTLLVDELFATGVVVVLTTDVNAVDFDVDVRLIVAGVRLVCREDSGMALACGFCTAVCALIGVFTGVALPNCKIRREPCVFYKSAQHLRKIHAATAL